jgi:broad specificity phosphatase PhoE
MLRQISNFKSDQARQSIQREEQKKGQRQRDWSWRSMSQQGEAAHLHDFFFLRHGARLDQRDFNWRLTSPTPYDSPLTHTGARQAFSAGAAIAQHAQGVQFVIHTSPFLRCVQTSLALAMALPTRPTMRIDAFLGEWMTPDYFEDIAAPPSMGELAYSAKHYMAVLAREKSSPDLSLRAKTRRAGALGEREFAYDTSRVTLDGPHDVHQFGSGGEYGETWPEMHDRFRRGLQKLIDFYNKPKATHELRTVVILVTHGAGCNAMLGAVSGRPVLKDVGLCALSHAVARNCLRATINSAEIGSCFSYGPVKDSAKLRDRYVLLMTADTSHLNVASSTSAPFYQSNASRSFSIHVSTLPASPVHRTWSSSGGSRPGLWQRQTPSRVSDVLKQPLVAQRPVTSPPAESHSAVARRPAPLGRQRSYSVVN